MRHIPRNDSGSEEGDVFETVGLGRFGTEDGFFILR